MVRSAVVGKHRVLVVEDDQIFQRPLQRTLETMGYDVLTAPSAEDALALLRTEPLHLVLTDTRLPGIDGLGLVRSIKAARPHVAVVVMTAQPTIDAAREAVRWGAEGYLVKPFEPAEAFVVLARALELRALRQATAPILSRTQET